MPTDITTSTEQAGQKFDGNFAVCAPNYPEGGWTTPKTDAGFAIAVTGNTPVTRMILQRAPKQTLGRTEQALYLAVVSVLMIMAIAPTSSAQPVSAQRPTHTINKPTVGVESGAPQAIWKRCSEVAPDVSYLIPRTNQFGGRTEASGSGEYGYQRAADCPYWVVDFLMNRFSHTWVSESGALMRENVIFFGDAFDLPSSSTANGTRPIVEEDCKRLEVDVFIYRKGPNENKFKIIRNRKGRGSWDGTKCVLSGLQGEEVSEHAPNSNILKFRIAVRVKLRGSWQQAAGYAIPAPPN